YQLHLDVTARPESSTTADAGQAPWRRLSLQWSCMEILDAGPLVASAVLHGHSDLLRATLTLRASAWTPVLHVDVTLTNVSEHAAVALRSASLTLAWAAGARQATGVRFEARQTPFVRELALPATIAARKLAIEAAGPAGHRRDAR